MNTLLQRLLFLPVGFIFHYIFLSLTDTLLSPRRDFRLRRPLTALGCSVVFAIVAPALHYLPRALFSIAFYLLVPVALYRGRIMQKLSAFALWMAIYPGSELLAAIIAPMCGWKSNVLSFPNQLLFDIVCCAVIFVFYTAVSAVRRVLSTRSDGRVWVGLCLTGLALLLCSVIIVLNYTEWTRIEEFHDIIYFPHDAIPAAPEGSPDLPSNLPRTPFLKDSLSTINAIGAFLPLIALYGLFTLIQRLDSSAQETERSRAMEERAIGELRRTRTNAAREQAYRQLRHDSQNHLLAIEALARNGETARLLDYITSLQTVFNASAPHVYCGNALIDGILEAKALRMQQSGISATWRVQSAPQTLPLSDLDLCGVFGNALDNAIEACERLPQGQPRKICTAFSCTERGFFLEITNTCLHAYDIVPRMRTRSEKRVSGAGLGLMSMQRIADRCNGEMLIKATDDSTIVLSIYLPA